MLVHDLIAPLNGDPYHDDQNPTLGRLGTNQDAGNQLASTAFSRSLFLR